VVIRMKSVVGRLLVLIVLFQCTWAFSKPNIQLSTDPGRSMNGENVMFKIRVSNDTADEVESPRMPVLADWEIENSFNSMGRQMRMSNGNISYIVTTEFTYILRPLRAGLLKIPSLIFKIGEHSYKTAEVTVQVDRLSGGNRSRQNPLPFSNNPLDPAPSNPFAAPPSLNYDFEIPDRESFFVRAESSKRSVYQGELITLAYSIYQRRLMSLGEPGISKFPDFKGFLKEELEIRKDFTPVPVQIQGEAMYRAELIRFAIFPLRSGRLRVEPLKFKAVVMPSAADIMNSLMNGQAPSSEGIPMDKSSQELIIDAKPLPPLAPNTPFTGGVGQFSVEIKSPASNQLQIDQPFSVKVTITGKGNVKSIEEPRFQIPKEIEASNVRTDYEFRNDATGFKSFDYLFIPRSPGKIKIEGLEWVYFDPAKEKYESFKGQPLEFEVTGGPPAPPKDPNLPPVKVWTTWKNGTQNFVSWRKIHSPSFVGHIAFWAAQGFLYAFFALVFWRQRTQLSQAAYFQKMPWEKTAQIIASRSEWDNQELALLIDLWMRERLHGLLKNPDSELHTESPRDEFIGQLRNELLVEYHNLIEPLKDYWLDLDIMRFSGARSTSAKGRDFFSKAVNVLNEISNALESSLSLKKAQPKNTRDRLKF